MHRRRLLQASGLTLLVLPFGTFLVQACYGNAATDDESPAAPPAIEGANAVYTSTLDGGHAHTFALALAALAAPADTHGETSNDDGHTHTVALSAAQLESVQNGDTVRVTTGNTESHTHVLAFVKID